MEGLTGRAGRDAREHRDMSSGSPRRTSAPGIKLSVQGSSFGICRVEFGFGIGVGGSGRGFGVEGLGLGLGVYGLGFRAQRLGFRCKI